MIPHVVLGVQTEEGLYLVADSDFPKELEGNICHFLCCNGHTVINPHTRLAGNIWKCLDNRKIVEFPDECKHELVLAVYIKDFQHGMETLRSRVNIVRVENFHKY